MPTTMFYDDHFAHAYYAHSAAVWWLLVATGLASGQTLAVIRKEFLQAGS